MTAEPSTYRRVAPGNTKMQLVLPQDMRRALDLMAERDGITRADGGASEVIRRAIKYYCPVDIAQETFERP